MVNNRGAHEVKGRHTCQSFHESVQQLEDSESSEDTEDVEQEQENMNVDKLSDDEAVSW
jgi:hypothetical protein